MAAGVVLSAVLGGATALGMAAFAEDAGVVTLLAAWSWGDSMGVAALVALRLRRSALSRH